MDVRDTNCQLRDAAAAPALADDNDAVRMVNRARRRQLAPHAIAAGLLLSGFAAETVAALTGMQALITAVVALISYGAVAVMAALSAKRHTPRRGRLMAAGLTSSTWLTAASLGINIELIAFLALVECGFGLHHWKTERAPIAPAELPTAAPVAEPAPQPEPEPTPLDVVEGRWGEKVYTSGRGIKGELQDGHNDEIGLTWTLALEDGLVLADVQRRLPNIASLLGIGEGNIQVDALPLMPDEQRDESRVRLQIVTNSPVIDAVPYVVPEMVDGFAPLGPYSDGRGIAAIPIVARKSVRNTVIIGSSGYGKSSTMNGLAATVTANYPTVKLHFDPKGNSSPDLQNNSTVGLPGLDDAELFTRAVEKLCEGRGYESILNGWSGYEPSTQRPIYLIIIDECDMLFGLPGMGKRWGVIAKTGRALGIPLLLATQYAGIIAFGNSETLRSNIANVVLMRTNSNSSDTLIAPGLPPSRSLPDDPGYGYLRAEGARRVSARAAILRSSDDAEPGQEHAGIVLYRHKDAAVDEIGRAALGELLVDPKQRKAARMIAIRVKLRKFLAGEKTAATNTAPADGAKLFSFPRIADYMPEPKGPQLSGPEQRYLEVLDQLGGKPRMREMERALVLKETHTRNLRDALVAKGLLVQLAGADGKPVAGRYGRPGVTLTATDDNEPDNAEEGAPVSATA